jgi:hypothetical protein
MNPRGPESARCLRGLPAPRRSWDRAIARRKGSCQPEGRDAMTGNEAVTSHRARSDRQRTPSPNIPPNRMATLVDDLDKRCLPRRRPHPGTSGRTPCTSRQPASGCTGGEVGLCESLEPAEREQLLGLLATLAQPAQARPGVHPRRSGPCGAPSPHGDARFEVLRGGLRARCAPAANSPSGCGEPALKRLSDAHGGA